MLIKVVFFSMILVVGLANALLACSGEVKNVANLELSNYYVRLPNGDNTTAYIKIREVEGKNCQITGARCSLAKATELHTHIDDNGVMKMRPVKAIEIKGKEIIELKPGGLHIMLLGLKDKEAFKGEKIIPITLIFADGTEETINFPVKESSHSGTEHHHH